MYNCQSCIMAAKCRDNIVDGTPVQECPDKLCSNDFVPMPSDPELANVIRVIVARCRQGITSDDLDN